MGGENHFDNLVIRVVNGQETRQLLVEQGDADLATTLALSAIPELESNPDLIVDHRFNLRVRYLALSTYGPLQSPQARQALCYAFPYDDVVNGVYEQYAKRAIGPVAELCHGFDPDTFLYGTDLDLASDLLREAGIATGTTLVAYHPPGDQETTTTLELFQFNLAQIGITLDIHQVDFATYVGVFTSDLPDAERPNILPSFWQPDYNDGWSHLWPQVSCAAWQSGNGGHYCNDRVEDLLAMARDATDGDIYQAALSEVQQIVTRDDPAAVYMVQPPWLTVLRRDVGGFAPNLIVGEIIDFYALHRLTADAGLEGT